MESVQNRLRYSVVCGLLISLSIGIPLSAHAKDAGASVLSWGEWFSALSRAAVVRLVPHSYDIKKPSAKACIAVDSVRSINELLALVNHRSEASTAWLYNGGWLAYDVAMLTQHIKALAEQGDEQATSVDEVVLSTEEAGSLQEAIDWLSWGLPWVEYLTSVCIASATSDGTTTYRVRLQSILSLSRMLQVWIAQRHTSRELLCGIGVAAHFILTVSEFFRDYNPNLGQSSSLTGAGAVTPIQQQAATATATTSTSATKTPSMVEPAQRSALVVDDHKDVKPAVPLAEQPVGVGTQAVSNSTTAVVEVQTSLVQGVIESGQKHTADENAAFAAAANGRTPDDVTAMLASLPPLQSLNRTLPSPYSPVVPLTSQPVAEIAAVQKAEEPKTPEIENALVEKDEEAASVDGSGFGALSAMVGDGKDAKQAKEPSVDPKTAAEIRYYRKVARVMTRELPARLEELNRQIDMARNRLRISVATQIDASHGDDTIQPMTDTLRRDALDTVVDTPEILVLVALRDECARDLAAANAEIAKVTDLPHVDRYQRMQALDQRMRSAAWYKGSRGTPVPTLVIDCSGDAQSASANASGSSAASASGSTPAS
jgi:hypothetical protein